MFEVKNEIAPPLLEEVFQIANPNYNLRNEREFKSISLGTKSLAFLGPKVWDKLPIYLKSINSLDEFKQNVKNWVPHDCPCRLYKNDTQHVSFI